MSLEPIDPIRVVPLRPPDPLKRERRPGEEGGRRRPKDEPEKRREEAEEDDGLPHIDVRA